MSPTLPTDCCREQNFLIATDSKFTSGPNAATKQEELGADKLSPHSRDRKAPMVSMNHKNAVPEAHARVFARLLKGALAAVLLVGLVAGAVSASPSFSRVAHTFAMSDVAYSGLDHADGRSEHNDYSPNCFASHLVVSAPSDIAVTSSTARKFARPDNRTAASLSIPPNPFPPEPLLGSIDI